MLRLLSASLWGLLLASLLAGCAHRQCSSTASGLGTGPTAPQGPNVPQPTATLTERGKIVADLSTLPSYEAVDQALSRPPKPLEYRVLTAGEVQCLAAANSPTARLLVAESEAVLSGGGGGILHRAAQCAAPMQSKLLNIRAIDERNKAAAMALELFYSLTEAEANRDLLEKSVAEVDHAAANLEQLKQSGLKIPTDRSALDRQKLDWLDRRIQLLSSIRQMQGQLQQLVGFNVDEIMPIWPEADLNVAVEPVDAAAAVTQGLVNRADIAALRMLGGNLDADTLPAARIGMAAINPALGASAAGQGPFGEAGRSAEAATRQSQAQQALADLEKSAAREIADAAQKIDAALRQIAVAKERWESWKQRVAGLEEKRESDGVTASDLSTARLELLRAEGDAVHRIIAWKIIQVKLKQAQGLLAAECGYGVSASCR
jgi:hypothetical protein